MQNIDGLQASWPREKPSAHPNHGKIYDDKDELKDSFIASIRKFGILERIAVTPSGTIVSGHRRMEAARRVGLDEVPVTILDLEDDLEIREALIDFNRQRDKTFAQKMREAKEVEAIEQERAKERQGDRTDIRDNCPRSDGGDYGRTRDKVADTVGFSSGKSYSRARKLWEAAEDGDVVAQHEVDRIDEGKASVSGSWKKVKDRQIDSGKSEDEAADDNAENTKADETLDPEDLILSAYTGTSADIFPDVLDLHVDTGAVIADVTFGSGTFWQQVPKNRYDLHATDLDPDRSPSTDHGVDYRDLPYDDGEMDVVILDPPFRNGFYNGNNAVDGDEFWIKDRYVGSTSGQLKYHEAVLNEYSVGGREARRVLDDDGTLIIKVQDEVANDEQRLTHREVTEIYEQQLGFSAEDLFVIVRPDTPTVAHMKNQKRARKNHSYFMVFT